MNRIFILVILSVLFCISAPGQDVTYLIKEGEQLEKSLKEEEALQKYLEALRLSPNSLSALVKCSEMSSIVGNHQKEKAKKTEYFEAAKTYAESALKQSENDPDANYVMAMAMGRMSMVNSGKDKAKYLRDIKKYADAALAANPQHTKSLFILGKWNLEIVSLNVTEKATLKVLYGGMPPASLSEAITNFEKVKAASPWFVLNYLELAKAYKANGQSDKSIEVLNRMLKLPPKTSDDYAYKAEGKKMLEGLL
jgi:tetratricopeptide (TPR) repeat protein